jgi:excinuclease ABC subunit A
MDWFGGYVPALEKSIRTLLEIVVTLPTDERALAVPRCCCSATAGGSPSIESTSGTPTWSMRRLAYGETDSKYRRCASAYKVPNASGIEGIKRLVHVDQKPIGRTPRSNLATYTGLFNHVRKLFADTPAARSHDFDAGRFSFNVAKGRCETCEGEGFVSVELLFMPSVYAPCPVCHGARFNEQTLQVTLRGKNIADVLHMTVEEAQAFFCNEAVIAKPLKLLSDIGLGYLRLGQPATELSGGEAQRVKLATELQRAQRGDALYVLDEPTTGLHAADVDKLLSQLQGLVDAGNTVVVVEHAMRVIAACDWVIDLGPGGGAAGGKIVATGTPLDVARHGDSLTATYLRKSMTWSM